MPDTPELNKRYAQARPDDTVYVLDPPRSPAMPDTLSRHGILIMGEDELRDTALALLRHIDALTAAVEGLYVFPEPDSQDGLIDRAAVLAILRGAE
jgi:hypothetical protein